MGISDSKKNNQVKLKSHRCRFGNVKDFHGRRKTAENHKSFNIESEFVQYTIQKPNPFPVSPFGSLNQPIISSQSPNSFSLFGSKMAQSLRDEPCPIQNVEPLMKWDQKPTHSFQQHMAKWMEDFHKPFAAVSQNSEFEMPYCYSKEFFNQECLKPVMFDYGSASQLAVPQDYRHHPLQMILIKSSVAQFIAEACDLNNAAKLYFDQFVDDRIRLEVGRPVFFEEKNEAMIYLVTVNEPNEDCKDVQLRNDCAIYTSSWQN